MTTIRVTGQIDSTHRLTATVPDGVPVGPIDVVLMLPAAESEAVDRVWLQGIAREWHDDLNDVQQDIYTVSDGQSPHEAG
jgi:hypothetical protein